MPTMKNILIIDSAINCAYSVFQATESEFKQIFPEDGQDIEYSEDLFERLSPEQAGLMTPIWDRPIEKKNAMGIHGTIFYGMEYKKEYYSSKRERDIAPSCINAAERKLYR